MADFRSNLTGDFYFFSFDFGEILHLFLHQLYHLNLHHHFQINFALLVSYFDRCRALIYAYFFDEISEFIAKRKPIIGICNGFQVLVKTGILPGNENGVLSSDAYKNRKATLTHNEKGHFECRDVVLKAIDSRSIWTAGIKMPIICPIAHGEGRFLPRSQEELDKLIANKQIALKYALIKADSEKMGDIQNANGCYPYNPNGSAEDIAGISDATGLVLGLMPHTENNIVQREVDPLERQEATKACLAIWKNGVQYAKNM